MEAIALVVEVPKGKFFNCFDKDAPLQGPLIAANSMTLGHRRCVNAGRAVGESGDKTLKSVLDVQIMQITVVMQQLWSFTPI